MRTLPGVLVALAVRVLREEHRERWSAEHRAELAALDTSGARLRYALGALASAPALRRATRSLPLRCRLGFWHRWQTGFTDDGGRFVECGICGYEPERSWWGNDQLFGGPRR